MQSNGNYRGLPSKSLVQIGFVSIRNYLKSRHWLPIEGSKKAAVFKHSTLPSVQVTIPLAPSYSDYAERIGDAIATIAASESRPAFEVFTDIILPPSDVLRFTFAAADTVTGTVRFDDGLELYTGVRQTLLSAALAAERHEKFYQRMSGSDDVDSFMARCRLGQTEVGSFTATFICPVQEHPENLIQAEFDPVLLNSPDPFPRRVTRNVMEAIDTLANAIRSDSVAELLSGEVSPISANLCDALLRMQPAPGGHLGIASSWARTLPLPTTASSVALPAEYFPVIRDIASALRPASAKVPTTFAGHVVELSSATLEGPLFGTVTLLIIDEESAVKAKVKLEADDFDVALLAFKERGLVSVKGELVRAARVCHLQSYTDFKRI